jgi:hypothetical protein
MVNSPRSEAESNEKLGVWGPYAGVDYNLTLCQLQSRLQHIYHGQPYARIDLNPLPESNLSPSQGRWILLLTTIRIFDFDEAKQKY